MGYVVRPYLREGAWGAVAGFRAAINMEGRKIGIESYTEIILAA